MPSIDRSLTRGYGLVNTTAINGNYAMTLYSLVNESNLLAAHRNAAALINALSINGSSAHWTQSPKNICLFNSSSLGCSINSFDYYNNTANLSIANKLSSQISITGIGCHLPDVQYSMPVNETVGSDSAVAIEFPCYNMVNVPVFVQNYEITVNYTQGSINSVVVGTLNVTTGGFP